jgi:fatty-acyl-CoA synthase
VYPAEVEHFLRTLPGVKAVAVIGVPDATWGEVGKAFIVRDEEATITADEVLRGCAGNLAKFKIPKYVEFLDALPVSDSGKILKKQLRAWHDERTHNS